MELCDQDLQTYIKNHGIDGKRLSEGCARRVLKHILKGLYFLANECKVIHRDIKLENILVKRITS